jgi:antitoxin Xre/MbcA/ParS-like protein
MAKLPPKSVSEQTPKKAKSLTRAFSMDDSEPGQRYLVFSDADGHTIRCTVRDMHFDDQKGEPIIVSFSAADYRLKGRLKKPSDGAVDGVLARASKVLGNREEALRWMGIPVRVLDFATPISLLGTKEGIERVTNVLGQMEHGVW